MNKMIIQILTIHPFIHPSIHGSIHPLGGFPRPFNEAFSAPGEDPADAVPARHGEAEDRPSADGGDGWRRDAGPETLELSVMERVRTGYKWLQVVVSGDNW